MVLYIHDIEWVLIPGRLVHKRETKYSLISYKMIVLPRGDLVFRTADNTPSVSDVLYISKIFKQLNADQGSFNCVEFS